VSRYCDFSNLRLQCIRKKYITR